MQRNHTLLNLISSPRTEERKFIILTFIHISKKFQFTFLLAKILGIGSLYASKQSWVTFCGQCRPFTYQASYNELIINWRLASSPYSYEDSHGFILGYVAYQPGKQRQAILLLQ